MFEVSFFAFLGFFFAAYAVVGNDALQTLGTFINSNSKLDWKWLFLFASSVLILTFVYGWYANELTQEVSAAAGIVQDSNTSFWEQRRDGSWGRLNKVKKYPIEVIQWYHILPPLALVIITRFGVPVSTSFMVLTVFAAVDGFTAMLGKSLTGYGLAFAVGLLVFLAITRTVEKFFAENDLAAKAPWGLASILGLLISAVVYFVPELLLSCDPAALTDPDSIKSCNKGLGKIATYKASVPYIIGSGFIIEAIIFAVSRKFGNASYWVILQWVTTAYLWGVWLIQDFANILVFMPRGITALEGLVALLIMVVLLGYTFWNKGGPVQKILRAKTAVTDIRSATMIDFIYATLLFFFKEVSEIPMSTTFVFLGLIAGREFGFSIMRKDLSVQKAWRLSLSDLSKAYIGLVISINMAVGLPRISQFMTGETVAPISSQFLIFVIIANVLLLSVAYFLLKPNDRVRKIINTIALGSAAIAFFALPIS